MKAATEQNANQGIKGCARKILSAIGDRREAALEPLLWDAAVQCGRLKPCLDTLADERRELLSAIASDLWGRTSHPEASVALLRHLAQ
ncbi:MAG: hypothetical protein ABIZ80_22660 [Bryobacteraceae bacterium]